MPLGALGALGAPHCFIAAAPFLMNLFILSFDRWGQGGRPALPRSSAGSAGPRRPLAAGRDLAALAADANEDAVAAAGDKMRARAALAAVRFRTHFDALARATVSQLTTSRCFKNRALTFSMKATVLLNFCLKKTIVLPSRKATRSKIALKHRS